MAVMQALHDNWLPGITSKAVASPGRCPYGAVSPDREVLQGTTFVREEQYLTFVKAELKGWVFIHLNIHMCVRQSKVIEE